MDVITRWNSSLDMLKNSFESLGTPKAKRHRSIDTEHEGPVPRCARTAHQHRHGLLNYARETSISPQNPPRPLQLIIAY
ncbi:Sulfotransferase 1C2A [Dissostichus eleginoides]|uniref:Sulfotransferase 1C2A n=1 Tax=Dissostichus eleginoides TaxID=100907 RepID=A0AAD9FD87_DISEL|nr:Sulfotransferase 1C2A [Dissostichus eleginoides]